MKTLWPLMKEEDGNVVVMLLLSLTILLGFTAMVIDVGRLYHERSILQNAVDASALAGAQGLMKSQSEAASKAMEYAAKNSFPITTGNLAITSESVHVTRQSTVQMTFAQIFGIQEATVSAKAEAKLAPVWPSKKIAPITIEYTAVPHETDLKCFNTGLLRGNCGYLDINSNGASGLVSNLINGVPLAVGTKFVQTEPGQKWGPVENAFQTLIDKDAGKAHCQKPETSNQSCERMIIIPLIKSWNGVTGKSTVEIVGFAGYWVERVDAPKRIVGKFQKLITSGDMKSPGVGNVYGVKLIN